MAAIRLLVAEQDITTFRVDAIVNSAHAGQCGRGGINGHIHHLAGVRLLQASRGLRSQPVGAVRLTLGYQLPARYILHAFAPTAHGPTEEEHQLLAQCYRRALALASQRQFRTLVFPVLGSGEHGFPFALAATIALTEIQRYLDQDTTLEYIIVTVDDDRGYDLSNLSEELPGYYMDEGWLLADLWESPLRRRHRSPNSPQRTSRGFSRRTTPRSRR